MSKEYIHGFSATEMQRLTKMQDILNDAELSALSLQGVRCLLDVGSGLGQMTRALARALGPGAQVVGIERERRQLEAAEGLASQAGETQLVEFRHGEALALPLRSDERGQFDMAHARFLLEHVADPLAVVREMVEAVRPGGRVVLFDDDHELLRFWPSCPEIEHVWRCYWESYRDRGLDPLVGRRLPNLLQEAGAQPTRVTSVFYGATYRMPLFDLVVDNLIGVVEGASESLFSSGVLGRHEMETGIASLNEWRQRKAATVWYSLPLAEGFRE